LMRRSHTIYFAMALVYAEAVLAIVPKTLSSRVPGFLSYPSNLHQAGELN
jgi:hypothetical protein